jgi:hypothetical protein
MRRADLSSSPDAVGVALVPDPMSRRHSDVNASPLVADGVTTGLPEVAPAEQSDVGPGTLVAALG